MEEVKVDKNIIVSVLNNTILFSDLNKKFIDKVARVIKCYKFNKGEKIIVEQYRGQDIFILLSGKIQVYFEQNKKRFIIKELLSSDIFGEIGFFIKHRSANCEVVEDSVIGIIKNKDFKKLISKDVLVKIINLLISRILQTDTEIKDLVFKSVPQRVCKEIMNRIRCKNVIEIDNIRTFAQKVASSRETVSRILSLLERIGVIRREKNKIVVIKKNVLKKLSR